MADNQARLEIQALAVALAVLLAACSSGPQVSGLYCVMNSQQEMNNPPENAQGFREIASMFPGDTDSFGPPMSQRNLPGMRWDRSNEYWYLSEAGELFLYSNTDDGYVYFWQFQAGADPLLKDHGLLDCTGE